MDHPGSLRPVVEQTTGFLLAIATIVIPLICVLL